MYFRHLADICRLIWAAYPSYVVNREILHETDKALQVAHFIATKEEIAAKSTWDGE